MSTWLKTLHTHAQLQMELRTKIILNTSEAHKKKHTSRKASSWNTCRKTCTKLQDYNIDLFGKGPAQHLTTDKAMDYRMVKDLLIAPLLGHERYIQFVEDRLVNGSVGLFDPIKNLKLNKGLSEKVTQQKSFNSERRLPSFWRTPI